MICYKCGLKYPYSKYIKRVINPFKIKKLVCNNCKTDLTDYYLNPKGKRISIYILAFIIMLIPLSLIINKNVFYPIFNFSAIIAILAVVIIVYILYLIYMSVIWLIFAVYK